MNRLVASSTEANSVQAVGGPQVSRAPSRRFAPVRPNNRAAGVAGAGWEDDGGDPANIPSAIIRPRKVSREIEQP
jgi:hypothetical protein